MASKTDKHFSFGLIGVLLLTQMDTFCLAVCLCESTDISMACEGHGLSSIPRCNHFNSAVRQINLSGNVIRSIGSTDFTFFPKLSILDLHLNSIKVIPCSTFRFQNNLTELNLGNNKISSLRCQIDSKRQGHLSLDYSNQLPYKDRVDTFDGLGDLQKLRLNSNMLTSLNSRSFASLKSLKALHLENNQIKVLETDTFKGLCNLNELDLSGNRLVLLKPSDFEGLSKLQVLKLNGNQILRIQRSTFIHCKEITEIDLRDNFLTDMEQSAFHCLSHLNILKLNNNNISSLDPQVFDSNVQLSYLGLNENPWNCSCGLLRIKQWLESTGSTTASVFVKCCQPDTVRGQYLDVMSSALTQSLGSVCSQAELHVQPGTSESARNTWMTKQDVSSRESPRAQRRVRRTIPRRLVKRTPGGVDVLQYPEQPADATQTRSAAISTGNGSFTSAPQVRNISGACAYNEHILLNLGSVTVSSDSVFLRWTVTGQANTGVYFRIMYDQFDTKTKFSRFVNIRQGMACKLSDLRPETPYFICVESVVDERVCPVASRDLCVGVVTEPEVLSGPEPETVILIFTGINSLSIVAILGLLACLGLALQKRLPTDAVSLIYARNRCESCAMCTVQMSDLNSAVKTNSSNTGTYQPNDTDAIDLPPGH
ncbi:uncharacterized protein tril [Alosa pseudoharengus]|uniref:uncharacterized protein tril n=1 Tax=Alosa pseudoharengus TaxID=34774 RepID=UPI003F8BCF11